jgi:prevent-host-death family protein
MKTVGIVEAKSRLSELVSQAEAGETIVLTKNGRPVAEIVGRSPRIEAAREAIDRIFARRPKGALAGTSIRELVDEGRKY